LIEFLDDVVAKEPLVKENLECLRIVLSSIFAKLKCESRDESKSTNILCVNYVDESVFEDYGGTGDTDKTYPDVPDMIVRHRLLKLHNRVYCLGRLFGYMEENILYELNLSEPKLSWKEMTPMSECRSDFGAAVWKGCLVVNGNSEPQRCTMSG